MIAAQFDHVEHWVFDLDNTLYPPRARLFDQIEIRMTNFVMAALNVDRAEADRLRAHYWQRYGTTLAGLMREHGVDPGPYLDDVHDISLDHLERDHDLAAMIGDLPGKRIVYTNGPVPYARNVLKARGLETAFHEVYGIESADFSPKPERGAFECVFAQAGCAPEKGAMFEDDHRNLAVPSDMGMKTVLVHRPDDPDHPHVQFRAPDLNGFLSHLVA